MREKSKKTIKKRLLALLLVFCMTFQMISYSPGNVVRAEGEISRYSADIIKDGNSTYKGEGIDPAENSNAGAFSSVNISFSTPAGGYTSAEGADTLFKLKLKPDSAYLHQEWGKIPADKQTDAANLLQDAMEADAANKDDKYKALSQYIDDNGNLPEINFDYTFDTGFLWKESSNPGITLGNARQVTTTIDGSEVTVGEYTFTQDGTAGALKLHFVFESFVYGVTTAMAGMSFTLGLQDSLFEGGNPVEVKWDQVTSSLNVGEWRDPSLPDTLDDNYTIDKSVVNKVGETNSVGDAMYVDYKLDLTAENDGDLRGKIVEDLLPEGLTVDSVTLGLNGAAESGIESGTTPGDGTYQTVTESGRAGFSYQFPGGAPLQRASLTIRAILTVEQYTEFMESGTGKLWNFTNQAFLRDPAKDGPIAQTEEIKTDMEATFMTKDGTQRAYDGKYFDWEINVNTQFSHLSNAYIIDSISKNQHTYVDGEPIKITKESAAPVEMSLEKTTDTNLINKAYADLTNALLQTSDKALLNSLETLTNNGNKAIYYESGDAQIMIIPFDKYENAKVKINYATLLKEPDKVTPSLNLSNKVKMIWSHYWYGNGIGKDDFNVNIDIDKGVAGNYDIVQKTADFQKDSGTMDWVFKINHYQKNAENVRIVEDLKAQNMSLADPADPSKNWTCKDQNGKTVTVHNSQSQGTPYYVYDNANEKLTFYFGNLTPDKYYELRLHTNVDGQMAQVTDDKSSVSNKATVLTKDNGTDVEHTTEAKQDVDNTIIQKVNTGYDQAAHQVKWTITVNQNKLPITDGTVTDVFNTNDMTFLNVDAIRKDGTAFTLDKDNRTASKNGQTIVWSADDNPVFTFKDQTNDESIYEIDVTTQLTEAFINKNLTTNAENNVVNTAVLRGLVKGMPIRDSKDIDLTDNKVSDDATAPIATTALNKHGQYDSGTQIITWTAAFNGGQANMKDRVITEDLSANPILELKHRDPKTGGLLTEPVKVYEGKWENGKIVKANDTPVIKDRSEFTDVADQGFKFTVPDKYANTILIFEFDTYITNSASSADVSNTINLEPLSGKDAGQEVSSGADGLDYFDIDEYASISVGPYIKVKKTSSSQDTSGKNQIKLGGATFTLTEYVAEGTPSDYDNATWKPSTVADKNRITNEDGQASFVNLVPTAALYKLEETKAPGGYDIDATQDSPKVYYFRFVNKGAFEAGTYKRSNVSISNGTASSNETVLEINRTVLKGFSFDRTNTPTGKLEFTKTDANGAGIENVEFTLVRDDKKVKDHTATSNASGKVIFEKLDPGIYALQETSAPDQYLLGGDRKVTVDENGTATIAAGEGLTGDTTAGYKISNQYVSGTIKINKVDSEKDTIKLRGAKFKIYSGVYDNKNQLIDDANDSGYNLIGEATTDGNGTAAFNNVPYSPSGYTIIESEPPTGYKATADKLITIQANAVAFEKNKNFTHTVADTVENTRLRYDVSLKKTNDNTPTAEALQKSFELTYTGNDSYDTWRDASNGVQIKDSKGSINRDNGKITVTTNDQGELQLTNLPYGDYKLTETTNNEATNIYQNLDLTIKKDQLIGHETTKTAPLVLTANGGTNTVVNKLKKASEFKITKTDDKGDKLKDVTFTLKGKDAYDRDVDMSQTTETDGVATFKDIPIGASSGDTAYTLTETQIGIGTSADTDGYTTDFTKTYKVFVKPAVNNDVTIEVKDSEDQAVTLTNNGVTITNEPVKGTIKFTKKDEDGRILKGIEFELRRVVNGVAQTTGEGMVFKAISGDNGAVSFANIPYANYKLVETKGADSSATKEFDIPKSKLTVTNSGTETFNYSESEVTNTLNKAGITLTKKDQAGMPLGGVEFAVKRQASSEADNKFKSFVLNPNGTEYSNYYKNETEVLTATSAADGTLTISGLAYGKYKLVETTKPDNPASDVSAPEITFTVNENGEIQDLHGTTKEGNNNIVTNTIKYGYINLLKQTDDGENLPGVKFDIYKTDAAGNKTGNAILTLTTDENGKLVKTEMEKDGVGLLTYGSYILEETSVDNAFTMSTESYKFTIDDTTTGEKGTTWISPGSTNNVIYKKANEGDPSANELKPITNTAKRQSITLTKTGRDNTALTGAVFAVYDGNTLVAELKESTSVSGTYNTLKTTDLNSTITDSVTEKKTITVSSANIEIPYVKDNKLLAGTYTIKEVKQPGGYVLPDAGKSVTITVDNGDVAATGNLTNDQTSFSVEKLSNEVVTADSNILSGASLEIRKDKDGAAVSDTFKWVSDGQPYAVTGLPAGTYWLVETAAPDGYKVAAPIQFTLADNGQLYKGAEIKDENKLADNKLTMTDIRVYGQAKLTKTVTGEPATDPSGIPFSLYKYTGRAPDPDNPATTDTLIADGLTTDSTGVIDTTSLTTVFNKETTKALSEGLWTGKYYFREQPSDDLVYDTTDNNNLVTFEITDQNHYADTGTHVESTMTNTRFMTKIAFKKYDTTDESGIQGVTFKLTRSTDGGSTYTEVVEEVGRGGIVVTDDKGEVTAQLLKKGKYQLEEVRAEGYSSDGAFKATFEIDDTHYNKNNKTFELNETTNWMVTSGRFEDNKGIANDRLPGSMTITKVDAQNNTKLDNAEFALYKDGGETPVLTGTTGNTYGYDNVKLNHTEAKGNAGELKITNLPWGHYKLVETTPPDGYILSSTPLEFTIKAGQVDFGAVQSAATTIENAQSTFTLNKADATSGTLVNGAAFQLTDDSLTDDSDKNKVIWVTPDNTTPVSTWSDITGILVAGKTYTLTETKAPDGYETAAPVKIVMDKQGVITVTEGGDHASVTNKSTVTVKDQPIEIGLEKIDAESNEKLEGAVFKVTGTFADKAITEIEVTPESFKEELKGHLIAGKTYKLTETTAPKGYEMAVLVQFTVDDTGKIVLEDSPAHAALDNNNETIVLKNTQNEIFIQKTDADGKAIGGGAEFSLTGAFAEGETVKTIKTEDSQPYSLKGLLIAGQTYVLSETRAADGYKLETRPVEITMSTAGTISVVADTAGSMAEVTADGLTLKFKDQPITLGLQKTDANNGNRPLKGAKFELTGDLADESKTHTIDLTQKESESLSALLIASTGTEKHEYTLTETTAPEGYQLQQTPVKFTVDKDGRVTITNIDAVKGFAALTEDKLSLSFANTLKQGNITFIKYGTNDENALNAKAELSGAVFGLYTDAGATIPVKDAAGTAFTATSGEDGSVAFKDIYVGTYYMKEIAAPSSYTADSTVYQAVIDKDGKCDGMHAVAGTEVSNEAIHEVTNQTVRGKISIAKTDSFDGKAIKDIEFTLTKKDKAGKDITVKTGKTDENGNLVFSNLLMDTEYRVYETKTHSGYVLSTVTESVTLSTEETKKAVAFTNDPTKLTFKKVDTTGAGLAGAEFTLYDGSQEKATATSDKDGMVTFLYLEKGNTYTVKETKRPGEDYLPSSTEFKAEVDKDGTCTLKNNDETVTEVVNADAGVITVNKTDADSKPLADTTFVLKNGNGEVIQTQTTGADGKLVFADVPMGSYTIVETAAPDPYAVSGDVTAVTLNRGANQKVSVSRVNTLSQVIFHKRGVITEGCAGNLQHAPLEGAVYGLYQDPECATEPVHTATSSNPGEGCRVIFTGVARGTWYVKEIEAPQYYTLDTTVYKAVVDGDGHFEGLTNLDDTKVADNRVVDAAVTTDIVLKKVNEQKPDEVLPDSTYGLFKKVAKTAPVQARAFSLFGRDNTPEVEDESEWQKIAEATTGQDGYLRFEGVLMGVEYSIRELKAPEGSHVSEKPVNIKFGVNDAGTPVIESIDLGLADPNDPNSAPTASVDPETGEIVWLEPSIVAEISKTDMNANLLAGAKLRITVKDENGAYVPLIREDGQPVEWISGDQPETFVKLMKIGKDYRLEEIEAPSGYKLAAPVDFIVKSPEQGVGPGENLSELVVLKNELTSLFISKTTINGTDELPGAVLTVYEAAEDGSIVRDEAGNEVVARTITGESLSWTSGTEMKKIEGLPAGAYVLREITAPDGYEVAEEITFTLMPDGAVTVGGEACEGNIVRMQDKPAPETVTPGVPDKPQTSTPNNPEISGGADTGIAGLVNPATFWGVMALLSVTALLVCSVVVWRRKRW